MAFYGVSPVSFESVSNVTATPSVDLGTRRMEGGTEYVYVYNAGSYEAWPGCPVTLLSLTSGYSVSVSNAASQVAVFAGGVHHSTLTTAGYGWIVVNGLCRVAPDSSFVSANAGDWLQIGVDGGYVAAPATLATGARIGKVISSMVTSSGASLASLGKAWIKSQVW